MKLAARLLAAAAVVWAVAIMAAPAALAASHPAICGAGAAVYFAGSLICHQRPERSFHLAGIQLPVCARCAGLYLAAALGGPLALAGSALSARKSQLLAIAAGLPTLATWSAEMLGLAHPSNVERAVAALPLGFAAAWLVITTMRRESG